ncbi:MAG TPA: DUF1629 domain-containing protein [Myxococcaceae bacterium]|nr:DUF1629 domain-containing protein [Myxococcaceae bacterium]
MGEYYDFWDSKEIPGRWYLKAPIGPDGWVNPELFVSGVGPVNLRGPLRLDFRRPGNPLDYTMADSGMPIASQRAAAIFREIAGPDVELIPVTVEGESEPYFIVNAIHAVDCVDEARSEGIRRWGPEDGRPERIGDYKPFDKLRIDPTRTEGRDLFRVKRCLVYLIASDRLKTALEGANLTGLRFIPV